MKVAVMLGSMALATMAVPLAAQAGESELLASCAKSFVAEKFADRVVTVRYESAYRGASPLTFRSTPEVSLVARGKESGRVLATATCKSSRGEVEVLPIVSATQS